MAVLAIGDVQGCYEQLRRLLKRARYNSDRDTLWFCGDLVNRGPKSLQVLRFVRKLGDGAVTVLGNHDLHLVSLAVDPRGALKRNPTLAPILQARDSDEIIDWLSKQPFYHYDKSLNAALVHAGIPPGWTRRQTKKRAARLRKRWRESILGSLREPPPIRWHGKLDKVEKDRFTCAAFTRMRFVDDKGKPEYSAKGHPSNYAGFLRPWFEFLHEDWSDVTILFGHWSTLGDTGVPGVIGLDSGCVWGRRLSAARLVHDDDDVELVSVGCGELGERA